MMMEILIRQATTHDAEALVAYGRMLSSEKDSNVEMSPGEFLYTIADERGIIQEYMQADNSIFLVAESKGDIVGMLSCRGGRRIARQHTADLSMSVRRDFRGQRIGTLLLTALMEWLDKNQIVKRIECSVFARNIAAIHLYETFGFEKEGCCRKAIFRSGQYLDTLIMAYLVDEVDIEADTLPVNCC
jgi:RimJ/RimL family protein N-acetyltransferase